MTVCQLASECVCQQGQLVGIVHNYRNQATHDQDKIDGREGHELAT